MKKLWLTFYPEEQKKIIFLLGILLLASLLELFGLILVIPYVNLMIDDSRIVEYLQRFPVLSYLLDFNGNYHVILSIWFGGFYLVKNLLLALLSFIQLTILKNIKSTITSRMFSHYMQQPYAFHLKSRSSELVRSITYDATIVVENVLKQGAMLISEIFLFLGVLVVLIWKNPLALSVFLIMIIPVVVVYLILKKRLVLWGKIMQNREADIIRHLQEGIGGIKDAIILGAQKFFEKNFEKDLQHQVYIKRNRDIAVIMPRYLIETLMMISMAGALFWMSQSGGLLKNISSIAFLAVVSVRILPMSNRILSSISAIRASVPSIDVVYNTAGPAIQTTKYQKQVAIETDRIELKQPFQQLTVEQLSFKYPETDPVLKEINITINKGETIGIVGGSGAGKTTLVDLLLGLLPPTGGSINCNDVPIHNNLCQWQKRIGYVQQVIFLMDTTIKENIAYGVTVDEIDLNRLEEVVKMAKLQNWIDELENGVDSIVGERGVRISGGQRQRIGIARALYHNPEILILDEATSALDNNTEKKIMDDIYAMNGERTIIMIAHRLDTIRQCDRILVIEGGKIVDSGTYDNLMMDSKYFKKIANQ